MAVFIHNITIQDVLDRLPLAKGTVTADSSGLNTGQLESWVITASGILNALMERMGIDPQALGENETELVREGILSYVEARALGARDYPEERISRAHRQWKDIKSTVADFPGALGKSKSASSTVVSTAPKGRAKTPKRFGDDFTGF